MTKPEIPILYRGNRLEDLIEALKAHLYPEGSRPFERRLIIVPHLGLKSFIVHRLAKDPDLQVAAGLEVTNLPQGYAKITKGVLPSSLELSFYIQHLLLPMIDQVPELSSYFGSGAKEKRIGPFCDQLAQSFLNYGIYGHRPLPSWQDTLYGEVEKKWTLPRNAKSGHYKGQIHLFGFSFLPESYFQFFEKLGAHFYFFSPCQIFWGDYYSPNEKSLLKKEMSREIAEEFTMSFSGQNPLLANWGRVGRKQFTAIEASSLDCNELYESVGDETALAGVQQDILEGVEQMRKNDGSITCFSSSSPFREVEILKDHLLGLFEEGIAPSDVAVFAPDIALYAPYIKAVFGSSENPIPFSISDLELGKEDEVAKAFGILMALPKMRFDRAAVLHLFSSSPFRSKFKLTKQSLSLYRKWIEKMQIRWGYTKEQRYLFYTQDAEENQLFANPNEGTWEGGMQRLVSALAYPTKDQMQWTEVEELNRLYTLIDSLAGDLSPLIDGTKWTFSTWLRYFACLMESYLIFDPAHDLYKGLQELAAALDPLDDREIPYSAVERSWQRLLAKKSASHSAPHLQAVSFSALSEGAIQPRKVIALLGMREDAFPVNENHSSLFLGALDYLPKRGESDRYLFLQALLSSREKLFLSYVRDASDKLGPAIPVEQLLAYFSGVEVTHHPAYPHDPDYFSSGHTSYSNHHFEVATQIEKKERRDPLISDFYTHRPLEQPLLEDPLTIEIHKLFQFARHPLRYYLNHELGIRPEGGAESDKAEYLLGSLQKYHLVREGVKRPLDEVLNEAEQNGELPVHLCNALAREQIAKEVEVWREALLNFALAPEEIERIPVDLAFTLDNGQEIRLVGRLNNVTPKGVLVKGTGKLEDQIRFWPHLLIANEMDLGPLLFIDSGERLEGGACSFSDYLSYFCLAKKRPSPLLPAFAKALLEGESSDLEKAIKKIGGAPDEIFSYLFFRDPPPRADVLHQTWSTYLQTLFGGLCASV
ncbi:MAG: RecBCD enzyme subunit RecC [Chlamydiae bacterium]|nr:RecBCD enzyme subunit RecC [Chlamydiota bacterium]